MKKNAYSLVELLGTITILGIVLLLVVPKVTNILNEKKKDLFFALGKNVIRQIEYFNDGFGDKYLSQLDLGDMNTNDIDINLSEAFIYDDIVHLNLVGKNKYQGMYLCDFVKSKKDVEISTTPCENNGENDGLVALNVELNGGTTSQSFESAYETGSTITLETPSKSNFAFDKWAVVKGDSTLNNSVLTIGTNYTILYALWTKNVSLIVNKDGGTSNQTFNSTYKTGTIIELVRPTKEDYNFMEWQIIRGNSTLSGDTLTIGTQGTEIKAIYERMETMLTVNLDGGSISTDYNGLHQIGETIILAEPQKEGYTFTGWTCSDPLALSGDTLTIGNDSLTITANWMKTDYTITYNLNSGSVSTENPSTYNIDTETFTLNNPTKEGYTFNGWAGSNGETPETSVQITQGSTGDKSYTANYTPITYTISYT